MQYFEVISILGEVDSSILSIQAAEQWCGVSVVLIHRTYRGFSHLGKFLLDQQSRGGRRIIHTIQRIPVHSRVLRPYLRIHRSHLHISTPLFPRLSTQRTIS